MMPVAAVSNAGTPFAPNVRLSYTYDSANNLRPVIDTINGHVKGSKLFTYDAKNRVTGITQSGNRVASKRVDMAPMMLR